MNSNGILDLDMEKIENRQQLRIFPRSIIFTMRECLRRLFMGLLMEEDKDKVVQNYQSLRHEIEEESIELDYDEINEREFKKYFRINSHLVESHALPQRNQAVWGSPRKWGGRGWKVEEG